MSSNKGLMMGMAVIVSMSMVVSGFSSFLIRERKKRSKHMQVTEQIVHLLMKFTLTTFT